MSKVNKSHAAGYALVSYQTGYLKANYYLEFSVAVMRSVETNKKKLTTYANIIKENNVQILFPDINKSNKHMDIYDFENNIASTGFMAIKGLAEGVIDSIVEERTKNGVFTTFENFLERIIPYGIDKKAMSALIGSGAFDCFTKNQERLLSVVNNKLEYLKMVKNHRNSGEGTQKTFYDLDMFEDTLSYLSSEPDNNGYDLYERLSMLCEYNNVGIHGDVLTSYTDIQHDLVMSKNQRDPEKIAKEGIVTGFLEEVFEQSKAGKAYLANMTGFDGEKYRLIITKAKADDVIGELAQYKKGMVIDVIGSFQFPKVEADDSSEEEDEMANKRSQEVVVFPRKVTIKTIENSYVKNDIIVDLDDPLVDRREALDYFGVKDVKELVTDVISKIMVKDTSIDAKECKIVKFRYNGRLFSLNKDVEITMDLIKKFGCKYTFN